MDRPIDDPEMGRQLTVQELVPRMVVIIGHATCRAWVTAWVVRVGLDYIAFMMGELNTTFIARLDEDGKLRDDSGKEILVFEYLGTI